MCLIVQKTAEQRITPEFASNVFHSNSDGWGMFYHEDGVLQTPKGMTLQSCLDNLEIIQDKEAVIHFRFATHGTRSLAMAHPFHVYKDIYMMHNGVMNHADWQCPNNEKSDTALFAEFIGELLGMTGDAEGAANEFIRSSRFRDFINPTIMGQRIVFADNAGIVPMDNALLYETTDGLKVSNVSMFTMNNPTYKHKPRKKKTSLFCLTYAKSDPYKDDFDVYDYANATHTSIDVDNFVMNFDSMSYDDLLDRVLEEPHLIVDSLFDIADTLSRRNIKRK